MYERKAGTVLRWRLILLLSLVSGVVYSAGFKGMIPGKTTRQQVLDRFGEPSKKFSRGGKLSDGMEYRGPCAITGTLEANFFFDKEQRLLRVEVYPARQLTKKNLVDVYGNEFEEEKTPSGAVVMVYKKQGLRVYLVRNSTQVRVVVYTQVKSG